MVVVEDSMVIGIVTSNDFFYKILNPTLGIGRPGVRLTIAKCANPKCIKEIMECIGKYPVKIVAVHNEPPADGKEADFYVHLDTEKADQIIKDLQSKGFTVDVRER